MKLLFDATKYITRIESPHVDESKEKREQVIEYIVKYFDMSPSDCLQKIRMSCKTYASGVLTEEVLNAHSAEALAVVGITYALQAFTESEAWEKNDYSKPLVGKQAFTLYCNCISKGLEINEWTMDEAKDKISNFHKQCELD